MTSPRTSRAQPLPSTFQEALEALGDDEVITAALGERLIETFKDDQGRELERFRAWVTDWEFAEYAQRL